MPFLGKTPSQLVDPEVDIDGGSINGTTIGDSSASPATVTTFTSSGIDDNADATAITINSSEQVGIGTTSPTDKLHVSVGSSGASAHSYTDLLLESSSHTAIQISGPNTAEQAIWFADPQASTAGGIMYYHPHNSLTFRTAETSRLRVDSDGLKFGNDTAASNALDDYEEGTWTPTIVGYGQTSPHSQTYSSQVGHYTKVGRLVQATYAITLSNKGNMSGSYVLLQGFPFNRGGGANHGGLTYFGNMATSVSSLWWEVTTTNGWLQYISTSGSTSSQYMPVSGLNSNTIIQGSVVYYST